MFSSFLTAITIALVATGAAAGVVERQTTTFSDVVRLHAVHGVTDLGPLVVGPNGNTVIGPTGSGTTFYIEESVGRIYTGSPAIMTIAPKPHGVLKFSIPVATFCTLSGPFIFTADEALSSAGCNVSTFDFVGGELRADAPGSFEVCGSLSSSSTAAPQVYFTEATPSSADSSCVLVDLVTVPVVTSP